MHYFPDAIILTHVEFDHADIYRDLDAVKTAFRRLVNLVPRRGRILAYDASGNVTACVANAFCAVERYGFSADSEWRIAALTQRQGHTAWSVVRGGEAWGEFAMPMAGEHNALNATAAAALAAGQGVPLEAIQEALRTFASVKRRLEVKALVNVSPSSTTSPITPPPFARLCGLYEPLTRPSRLWAVLEPRSNTLRRNVFETELVEALGLADEVVLAGVFKQESIPEASDYILRRSWKAFGEKAVKPSCMAPRLRSWRR